MFAGHIIEGAEGVGVLAWTAALGEGFAGAGCGGSWSGGGLSGFLASRWEVGRVGVVGVGGALDGLVLQIAAEQDR